MSVRRSAPYADRVEEDGRVLVYEGHDQPQIRGGADPKLVDQPMFTPRGSLTQNGIFWRAAHAYKSGQAPSELVRVYEKLRGGIWVFNGVFELVDAWQETTDARKVFKFKLVLSEPENTHAEAPAFPKAMEHARLIPSHVKIEVWMRDRGACVLCGSEENLHFDHVIPFSKGGSSLVAANIQLFCANHNLAKRDRIE
jgi:hypothetical protein